MNAEAVATIVENLTAAGKELCDCAAKMDARRIAYEKEQIATAMSEQMDPEYPAQCEDLG